MLDRFGDDVAVADEKVTAFTSRHPLQSTHPIDGIRDVGDLPCLFEKSEGAALAVPSPVTPPGAALRVYGWTRLKVQGAPGNFVRHFSVLRFHQLESRKIVRNLVGCSVVTAAAALI